MSTTALITLSTLLATTTAVDAGPSHSILPAVCIAQMGPAQLHPPPKWRPLIPTVVFGVDYSPDQQQQFQVDRQHLPDLAELSWTTEPDGADARHNIRAMTRWTLALRWQTGPSPSPMPASAASHDLPPYCGELSALDTREPVDLEGAVEHWTETRRLHSLLGITHAEEVRR